MGVRGVRVATCIPYNWSRWSNTILCLDSWQMRRSGLHPSYQSDTVCIEMTHSHSHLLTHTLIAPLTHSLTHSHSHTHTHTLTAPLTHSHSHTHTYSLTHSQHHSHTHTNSKQIVEILIFSNCLFNITWHLLIYLRLITWYRGLVTWQWRLFMWHWGIVSRLVSNFGIHRLVTWCVTWLWGLIVWPFLHTHTNTHTYTHKLVSILTKSGLLLLCAVWRVGLRFVRGKVTPRCDLTQRPLKNWNLFKCIIYEYRYIRGSKQRKKNSLILKVISISPNSWQLLDEFCSVCNT